MDNVQLTEKMESLEKKMDIILEEIQEQKIKRIAGEELKDELTRIGKEVYSSALNELEDVHDYISTGDFMFLAKKVLRNVNNITEMIGQVENVRDFLSDFSPLGREIIHDTIGTLDEMDRKGYFEFLKGSLTILDNIVANYSKEDVQKLGENVIVIMDTVKNLTQPEIMNSLNAVVKIYNQTEVEKDKAPSLMKLLKKLNKPETRRSMDFAVTLLENISKENIK